MDVQGPGAHRSVGPGPTKRGDISVGLYVPLLEFDQNNVLLSKQKVLANAITDIWEGKLNKTK